MRKIVAGVLFAFLVLLLLLLCGCASVRTIQKKSPNYPAILGDITVDLEKNQLVFLFYKEGVYTVSFLPAKSSVSQKDLPLEFSVKVIGLGEENIFYELRQPIKVSPDLIRVKIERICELGIYDLPPP